MLYISCVYSHSCVTFDFRMSLFTKDYWYFSLRRIIIYFVSYIFWDKNAFTFATYSFMLNITLIYELEIRSSTSNRFYCTLTLNFAYLRFFRAICFLFRKIVNESVVLMFNFSGTVYPRNRFFFFTLMK